MRRAEQKHHDRRRSIVHPERRAQIVKDRKHGQRHWHKEKRPFQQGDLPSADKIAEPRGVIQQQEKSGEPEPWAAQALRGRRLTRSVSSSR